MPIRNHRGTILDKIDYLMNHTLMKSPIVIEIEEFLSAYPISARGLAREAGVTPSTVLHVISGGRKDMHSANADKLRNAMRRLRKILKSSTLPSSDRSLTV